jgi:hypothetical protein
VFDSALDKLVEADALGRSGCDGARMKLGIDACIEAAWKMAHRIDAVLPADVEQNRQGLGAFGFESGNSLA